MTINKSNGDPATLKKQQANNGTGAANNGNCQNQFTEWEKYAYTSVMCFTMITYGICNSTFFPAFVDLKYALNTSLNMIALISTFMCFGYIMGSLIGFLYKYINRQLTLIILLIIMGLTVIFIPYSEHLWQLYMYFVLIGMCAGTWNSTNNVWLIEMWQKQSGPIMQLSQFTYGIGTILGPLIDRSYLLGEIHHLNGDGGGSGGHFGGHGGGGGGTTSIDSDLGFNVTSMNVFNKTGAVYDDSEERKRLLKTPFLISGCLHLIGPCLMLIMFLVKKYRYVPIKAKEIEDKSKLKLFDREGAPKLLIIIITCIFLAFYSISEVIYLEFGATYFQYIPIRLSASKAAEIFSAMSLSYTIGRGINIFVAFKVKLHIIIAYHFLIIIAAIITLLTVQHSLIQLWIGSLMLSFGFSPIFPAVFAFIGQHLEITNRIGTVLIFAHACLNIIVPFILGTYLEKYPFVFPVGIIMNVSVGIVMYFFILYVIRQTKLKYKDLSEYKCSPQFIATATNGTDIPLRECV
ncbi:sodium-dependent glucose transporter 1-like [Oppia nitens]|uniref:sodium-dependent glucose transporter 1-like n=1 Tax=Oppia nitens TaxID=1686743 RepID=UPI0023DAB3A6|nr:sodium-dependent glucose transporter 1-like [Oppia nitens]